MKALALLAPKSTAPTTSKLLLVDTVKFDRETHVMAMRHSITSHVMRTTAITGDLR